MIVKLAYKNEIRISSAADSFSSLLKQVKTVFPTAPTHPHLFYIDSDGDKITISSTSDIESLKSISNGKIIKIQVAQSETKETATQQQESEVVEHDDESMIKELVASNLAGTYRRAAKSFEIEEEEMIQDLAKIHIHRIGQKALTSLLSQLPSKQV